MRSVLTCAIAALSDGAGVLLGNCSSTKDADAKCSVAHGMFSLCTYNVNKRGNRNARLSVGV